MIPDYEYGSIIDTKRGKFKVISFGDRIIHLSSFGKLCILSFNRKGMEPKFYLCERLKRKVVEEQQVR
tara:strand:- start:978 stop:1181 length:204 start_codon:yes stop_codon:yes gene_type:complete